MEYPISHKSETRASDPGAISGTGRNIYKVSIREADIEKAKQTRRINTMRKSNSKAFRALVAEYYNSIVTTPEEQEELSTAFWTYYADHKKLESNYQKSFENFVNACATNFDFETYEQRELLKSWYAETDAETQKFTDDQVSRFFCFSIYSEFERRSKIYA